MKGHGTRLGILMILILLVCITAIVFLGTDTFSIKKITVYGNNAVDEAVIINTSGISYNDNIFKINKALVKQRIENSPPYPIVLSILLKLPNEAEIKVQERTPAAVVPYLSSNLVIDKTCFIIDIEKQRAETSYPSIEGVIIQSFAKGSKLKLIESESFKLRVLLNLLESICKQGVGDILATINIEDPDNLKLYTRDGIEIVVGQAVELDRKLGWLRSDAYSELLRQGLKGTLDVSVPGKAIFKPEEQKSEVVD